MHTKIREGFMWSWTVYDGPRWVAGGGCSTEACARKCARRAVREAKQKQKQKEVL